VSDEALSDDDWVEQVYVASYRRLVGQFYLICGGDLAAAEDIVCEAFVRAVAHARTFRRTDNPEAWLRRVALNIHHSRWRRLATSARLHHKVIDTVDPTPAVDLTDEHLTLLAALRELPETQREAIVLHHLADRPLAEIAATLGVPIGTVKARLSRGRAALASVLTEDEEEPHV
jgi:RNA polymerase sigma-70 factor (ECF subfamily)